MPIIEHIEKNQFEGALNGCTYYSMIQRNSQNPWHSCAPNHSVHDILHPDSKWIRLANLPERRSHCVAVTVGDDETFGNRQILVIGGKNESRVCVTSSVLYQESTGSWTTLPFRLNHDRTHCQVAKLGSKIYVFGGFSCSTPHSIWSTFEVLDWAEPPDERRWCLYDLPSFVSCEGKRSAYSVVAVDKCIYLLGGFVDIRGAQATRDVFIWNTGSDVWSCGTKMGSTRALATAARLGNHLVVIGGTRSVPNFVKSAEQLDVTAKDATWVPCEPMLKPRGYSNTHAIGDKLLIIGSGCSDDGDVDGEVWEGTKRSKLAPRFTIRSKSFRSNWFEPPFVSVMVGSDLLIAGGFSDWGSYLSQVECLLSPYRVFQHQLKQIRSETLLNEDESPSGLLPHLFHRLGEKHLTSLLFHFVREKCSVLVAGNELIVDSALDRELHLI